MNNRDEIIRIILKIQPSTQAIYLFGSFGTKDEWPNSDVDIALLLPHSIAKEVGSFLLSGLQIALEDLLKKEVDLINLRQVSTVFQKEVIADNRRVFCADPYVADEFEMLVLSLYQKLNQERQGILDEFQKSGRAYSV